ncbi:MAG: glycoside hydrolase family 140 protein [Sedimentisphaerales bacterium]|nr:glycoside hydrolase family 140 protein [Sedimentisphaerales bacterium]
MMNRFSKIIMSLLFLLHGGMILTARPLQPLKVSDENPHYFAYEDGTPFVYLGDTAWELFRRTTRAEADHYLQTRMEQGFMVIMACGPGVEKMSGKLDTGIHLPNRYGYKPFENDDFNTPRVVAGSENDYWDHVDYVIDKCEQLGLYIALLPYWARDYVPNPIDASTGYRLGCWYGRRYGNRSHVIWVLGGDNEGDNPREKEIFDKTAEGIALGAGKDISELFMTYHCNGWKDDPHSSGYYLHNKSWLDFNGIQSGHYRDGVQGSHRHPSYETMSDDYHRRPIKPSVNLEAVYEGIYDSFQISNPRLDAYDVRKTAYWTFFTGGAGYTYGHNNVWQFFSPRYQPRFHADTPWDQVMDNASAHQMTYLKRLILSRPFLKRAPDQAMIVSDAGIDGDHKTAIRAKDGSYAMVYIPSRQAFTIDLSIFSGTVEAWWYNPRDDKCYDESGKRTTQSFGRYVNRGTKEFTPPSIGPDWILVLDDASKNFPVPGQ